MNIFVKQIPHVRKGENGGAWKHLILVGNSVMLNVVYATAFSSQIFM